MKKKFNLCNQARQALIIKMSMKPRKVYKVTDRFLKLLNSGISREEVTGGLKIWGLENEAKAIWEHIEGCLKKECAEIRESQKVI